MENASQRRRGYSARSPTESDFSHELKDASWLEEDFSRVNLKTSGKGITNHISDVFLPTPAAEKNSEAFIKEKGEGYFYGVINEHFYMFLLLGAAIFTRFFRIGLLNVPVWDEIHFGLFGSHYHLRTFYHDVHPPLGKLLVALGGLIAGYDGTFDFTHTTFPLSVNYTMMRMFHAVFGIALIPLAYFTTLQLGLSRRVCLLSASLILFDNAITLLSRFIVLDAILLFFNALSLYFLVAFHQSQAQPFGKRWWWNLFGLGLSLGLVVSVKWIGLFVIALAGLYTLEDLWTRLNYMDSDKYAYSKHWLARILCLLIVPSLVYIATFWVHFAILTRPGTGDGVMTSLFQAKLKDNPLLTCHPDLLYMSKITLRSGSMFGALLHSSNHTYPRRQERLITAYDHIHPDNDWIVWYPTYERSQPILSREYPYGLPPTLKPIVKVHNGDVIRLTHATTGRHLRLNTTQDALVAGPDALLVGCDDGDSTHDDWQVELIEDILPSNSSTIQTLTSRFQLRNPVTGCLLGSGYNKYPEWGFLQNEVYCVKDTSSRSADTIWNVEYHNHEAVSNAPPRNIPRYFFKDFFVLNFAMWNINRILIPDQDKYDHLASQAWEWPLMLRGIRASPWMGDAIKYFILGNPIIWWGTTLALIFYVGLFVYYRLRMQRKVKEWIEGDWIQFTLIGKFFIVGWFLQYFPFFLMGRVLYLHHYLPALYFLCLAAPFVLEHVLVSLRLSPKSLDRAFFFVFLTVGLVFVYFSPLTFGTTSPSAEFASKAWLKTWHLHGQESA